jgi:hypothetical protein
MSGGAESGTGMMGGWEMAGESGGAEVSIRTACLDLCISVSVVGVKIGRTLQRQ